MSRIDKCATIGVVFTLKMAKEGRKNEFVSNKDIRKRVGGIVNTDAMVSERGGDYFIPFPKLLELGDQEQLYIDLLKGKKKVKRDLIACRETAKKLQQKFHNYWETHKYNNENYDEISGKHNPSLVWENFLKCKEYVKIQPSGEEPRWILHCAYQVADGRGHGENEKPKPINKYIAEKTLEIKSHLDIQARINYYEKAVETVTKELRDIESRLEEIRAKQRKIEDEEWENSDIGKIPLAYYPDLIKEALEKDIS